MEDKVNTGLEQLEMGAAEARRLQGQTSRRIAEAISISVKHYLMPKRDSNIHLPLLGGRSSPWTMWDSPSCPARYITTNTITIITQCYVLICLRCTDAPWLRGSSSTCWCWVRLGWASPVWSTPCCGVRYGAGNIPLTKFSQPRSQGVYSKSRVSNMRAVVAAFKQGKALSSSMVFLNFVLVGLKL